MQKIVPTLVILLLIFLAVLAYRTFFLSPTQPPKSAVPSASQPSSSPADHFRVVTQTSPGFVATTTPSTTSQSAPETEIVASSTEPLAQGLDTLTSPPETGPPVEPIVEPKPTTAAIVLENPLEGSRVASPIFISGKAKISGKIFFRIATLSGTPLIQESAEIRGIADAEGFRPYRIRIGYEFSSTREGYIEVYSHAVSGVEENLVRVKVFFD